MTSRAWGVLGAFGAVVGCGSSVDVDAPGPATGAASASAGATSGAGGARGSATTGGAGGDTGSGGAAAGGASGSTCVEPDYCSCGANAACTPVAEDCFCPCGIEPCEPDCECDCGGGKYLGCAPTSVTNAGALEGIWLIGWSGGAHHFSWVRIDTDFQITVNDGASLSSNLPHYPCNGTGTWMLTAKPESVGLYLPGDCGFSALTFTQWTGTPEWPKGCLQSAIVEQTGSPLALTACRFPPTQCDAAMSSCIDPLAP